MFANMASTQRSGENPAIIKRRAVEEHYRNFEAIKEVDLHYAHRASWEVQTQAMIERNVVANYARTLEEQAGAQLLERRQKLLELYQTDEAEQKVALANLRETAAQRAKRMIGHARQLKEKREAESRAFAQQMYNKQWRDGCDDLRMIGTDQFAAECFDEVARQREEKKLRQKQMQHEEETWARMWEEDRLRRVEVEDDQKRRRQRFNRETSIALLTQMEQNRNKKDAETLRQEEERAAFQAQMEADKEYARQKAEELANMRKQQQLEVVQFNENTKQAKATMAAKAKELALRDLNQKLEEERQDDNAKARAKEKARSDMRDYMEYLRERKAEDRALERQIEKLAQEEQDRTDHKRDMQWEKERQARELLLKETLAGRAEQIRIARLEAGKLEHTLAREKEIVRQDVLRAAEEERAEELAYRAKMTANQNDLLRQVQERRNQAKIAHNIKIEEREAAIEAERQYRAFVAREKQAAAAALAAAGH